MGRSPTGYRARGPRSILVGSITMPRTIPSTASTAIPATRKGIKRIHTSGYATSANNASGQQSTRRMHQTRNLVIIELESNRAKLEMSDLATSRTAGHPGQGLSSDRHFSFPMLASVR